MPPSEKIAFAIVVAAVLSVYAAELALILSKLLARRKPRKKNRLRTAGATLLHTLALVGIACYAYAYFVEPYWIEVTTIEIPTDKLDRASFRIVQISDLHCDARGTAEDKVVRIINSLEPDAVVFTGDALNDADALPLLKKTLRDIQAELGKFAVYGNFDTGRYPGIDLFSDTGFQLLDRNTGPAVLNRDDETIAIAGLTVGDRQGLADLQQSLPCDRYNILLQHHTNLVEKAACPNIDLYLAGHTHGGQVCLPFYGAVITLQKFGKKYESGLYQVGPTTLYVNRGIGFENAPAPRIRFLARPEITVFDIKPPAK